MLTKPSDKTGKTILVDSLSLIVKCALQIILLFLMIDAFSVYFSLYQNYDVGEL